MKPIPLLYFVTPEIGNDIAKWKRLIQKAVEGGIEMIQIRDKTSPKHLIFEAAQEIQPLLKTANIPLIINDDVDLALALKADGIHLGQSDLKVTQARAMLGDKALVGLSVETLEQAANSQCENITYLAASPVFETKTKRDCQEPWGISGLKHLCSVSCHPIYAIGGIHLNNIESVLGCGVAGIAIISAIAQANCPKTATKEFLNSIRQYARGNVPKIIDG